MAFQVCNDTSEAIELCERYNLYLKPMWKIKVSVQLPPLKAPGQAISSWEVMEKLRNMIKPDEFTSLKVSKTNLILVQFECEVEKKATSKRVLQKLQSNCMKLSGFADVLKIRAAPAKLVYPSRHDWDSFFRDAKNIDEMKPGERPDTIFVQNLPTRWFSEDSPEKPSDYILKKAFEAFGDIRHVSIPSRHGCNLNETFGKISTFNCDLVFDAYIQFKEYISFVKAMDSLKGMKLLYKITGAKAHSVDIKVDFDKTKYLSDKSIRHRAAEEKKQPGRNVLKESLVLEYANSTLSEPIEDPEDKIESIKKAFADRKVKKMKKSTSKKAELRRQREAKNLLKALFHKVEMAEMGRKAKGQEEIVSEQLQQQKLLEKLAKQEKKKVQEKAKQKRTYLQEQEKILREKLLKNLKTREQRRTEQLREKLRKDMAGRKILKSVLVVSQKPEDASSSSKRY